MARPGILILATALLVGVLACNETAEEPTRYDLTISSSTGGSVTEPGEGVFNYEEGASVTLVADASAGYVFIEWIGEVNTIADVHAPSTTITILASYDIHASFGRAIWNWHDLSAVRDDPGASYALMTDLDSAAAGYAELASPEANGGRGWQPIGASAQGFSGSFDGRGHSIKDMFIDRPDEDNVGLFGFVASGGVIKSVAVSSFTVVGREGVGGLVGWNEGGSVGGAYSAGTVTGESSVGGLVGCNSRGTVSDSSSGGGVSGREQVGGLVGYNYRGAASNTFSISSVDGDDRVGGLIGHNYQGAVSDSYSAGSVSGTDRVGGLVGQNLQGAVSNCFWDAETSGTEVSSGGTGKTTAEMQSITTFTDTETEGLHEPWEMVSVASGSTDTTFTWNIVDGLTYPFLSTQPII